MKLILIGLLLSTAALAKSNDLAHMPKPFNTANGKAVFADFSEAVYNITYDSVKKQATVQAEIKLNLPEAGHLVFDSVEVPYAVTIDGQDVVAIETKTPSNETTVRVLEKEIPRGAHVLKMEVDLKNLVEYTPTGVKSAFWTSDLSERQFLERYLPANFEFDQVKMTFNLKFIGSKNTQVIYTNGKVTKLDASSYRIVYPEYYTSSSIFFHTVPQGATDELRFSIKSIDGRELPAVVYMQKGILNGGQAALESWKTMTMNVIQELESDYGAFLHPQVIVYNAGLGGMEYCGATMTEKRALGHELFHSYFARGVMPANGNSGWVDEALASWRDEGYKSDEVMTGSSQMSSRAYYTRTTDRAAYSFGERFMRFLDKKFTEKGGLKPFMRYMIEKRSLAPVFVEEYIKEMGAFYGMSVEGDFKKYTYGSSTSMPKSFGAEKAIHRKMTPAELKKYL